MPPKPSEKWQTGQHTAYRLDGQQPAVDADARSECFELRFEDGHVGRAELCLRTQRVDRPSWERDRELGIAVRAWLVARGQRELNLQDLAGAPLDGGALSLADFDFDPNASRAGVPKLVSLAPSNFDLLDALGLAPQLLACEDSTPLPADTAVPRLGPDLNPNLDAVQALVPTLVLASLSVPGMERVVMGLRRRGLAHLVFAPRRLAEIPEDLTRLGRAVGIDATPARQRFEAQRDVLERASAGLLRPVRVFLEWWPRPQFSPGEDCYSNELIALAGGINIFHDCPGSSIEVSIQDVAQRYPELAFVSWCGVDVDKLDPSRLWSRPELAALEMAQAQRVFALDEAWSGRPGPKVLLAAERMAEEIGRYARAQGLLT